MGPRLGLLLLLPVGCAQVPADEVARMTAALEHSQASLAAVTRGGITPAELSPSLGRVASRPATLAGLGRTRRADEAPGTRPVAAAQLLGAVPDALRRWLGEPVRRRLEGPAEIWLYAAPDCALDLVLYRDAGSLRVAHAAARAHGAVTQTEDSCLAQISAAAGRPVPVASETTPGLPHEPGV